jgi:hypothetical protein
MFVPVHEPVEEISNPRFVSVDVDVDVLISDIVVSLAVCAPDSDSARSSLERDVVTRFNVRSVVSHATSADDVSSVEDLKNATCVGVPLNVVDTVSQSSVASDPEIEAIRGTCPTAPSVDGNTYDVFVVIAPARRDTVLSAGYDADVLGSKKVSRDELFVEFVSTRSAFWTTAAFGSST